MQGAEQSLRRIKMLSGCEFLEDNDSQNRKPPYHMINQLTALLPLEPLTPLHQNRPIDRQQRRIHYYRIEFELNRMSYIWFQKRFEKDFK
jgi:hypothetical protein